MKLLFCGDVVGRSGRETIEKYVPPLKQEKNIDLIVVNGENAASGFGITEEICQFFFQHSVDIITTGNHVWDRKEILHFIQTEPRLLRPHNYANPSVPGKGIAIHTLKSQKKVIIINLLGRLFMNDDSVNAFHAADALLKKYSLSHPEIAGIIVDFHAEATSEKMAMGNYLDGRVSLVVGTHTHIPTADTRILPKGTAYQTDAGMCGDYDSIIGMEKQGIFERFLGKPNAPRMQAASAEGTLCAVLVEIDDQTGLAQNIERIILGPLNALSNA